jgi:hypothetical protein
MLAAPGGDAPLAGRNASRQSALRRAATAAPPGRPPAARSCRFALASWSATRVLVSVKSRPSSHAAAYDTSNRPVAESYRRSSSAHSAGKSSVDADVWCARRASSPSWR